MRKMRTVFLTNDMYAFIANHHEAVFSYAELNNAIDFANEYKTAFTKWLTTKTSDDFYDKYVKHRTSAVKMCVNNAKQLARQLVAQHENRCPSLDIPIVNTCNLACAHCSMVAPLATRAVYADVQQLRRTCEQLQRICTEQHEPLNIDVFGGEPLLHPQLAEILMTIHQLFPRTNISIATNGLLLPNISKSVATAIKLCKCSIVISIYGPGVYFNGTTCKVNAPLPHADCEHCYANPYNVSISTTGGNATVYTNGSTMWPNGDIMFCSKVRTAYILDKYDRWHVLAPDDVINVHDITTFEELNTFFAKQQCAFVSHCIKPETVPWHVSTHDLSEWVEN